jgi:predicted amidohydrolase YtcJ
VTAAERIFRNAVIRTQDPQRPWASAMAVAGGRIIAVDDGVEALAGEGSVTVDLGGAFILPGLIDIHNHHSLAGAADLFECNFLPTDTLETILETVARWSVTLEPGAWVIGGSWGSDLFDQLSRLETLERLAAASGGRPV